MGVVESLVVMVNIESPKTSAHLDAIFILKWLEIILKAAANFN